jgi:hypothetical protein
VRWILLLTFIIYWFAPAGVGRAATSILIDSEIRLSQPWTSIHHQEKESIKAMLNYLLRSPSAKIVIKVATKRAAGYGKTLVDIIDGGDLSLTDTTMIRRFYRDRPEHMMIESRSKIYLNRHLDAFDAMLDLIHELTHFAYRQEFNPYRSDFSLGSFVRSTIEGEGGEVDAYMTECRVVRDIFPSRLSQGESCQQVIDPKNGHLSRSWGVKQFYRIGKFYPQYQDMLMRHRVPKEYFSHLSEQEPIFISSAYSLPYPVAAVKEYLTILERTCANESKRVGVMRANGNRSPSSLSLHCQTRPD